MNVVMSLIVWIEVLNQSIWRTYHKIPTMGALTCLGFRFSLTSNCNMYTCSRRPTFFDPEGPQLPVPPFEQSREVQAPHLPCAWHALSWGGKGGVSGKETGECVWEPGLRSKPPLSRLVHHDPQVNPTNTSFKALSGDICMCFSNTRIRSKSKGIAAHWSSFSAARSFTFFLMVLSKALGQVRIDIKNTFTVHFPYIAVYNIHIAKHS